MSSGVSLRRIKTLTWARFWKENSAYGLFLSEGPTDSLTTWPAEFTDTDNALGWTFNFNQWPLFSRNLGGVCIFVRLLCVFPCICNEWTEMEMNGRKWKSGNSKVRGNLKERKKERFYMLGGHWEFSISFHSFILTSGRRTRTKTDRAVLCLLSASLLDCTFVLWFFL